MDRDRGNNRRTYNNGNGGGGRSYYYNNYNQQPHHRREFHSQSQRNSGGNLNLNGHGVGAHGGDINDYMPGISSILYSSFSSSSTGPPSLSSWRHLMKRQNDLICDRARILKDFDLRQVEEEKAELRRLAEDLKKDRQDGNNSNSPYSNNATPPTQPPPPTKDKQKKEKESREKAKLDDENPKNSVPTTTTTSSHCSTGGDSRDSHSDSDCNVATPRSSKKGKGKKKISLEVEKAALLEKCNVREKKLETDVQRFYNEMERKLMEMDRKNTYDLYNKNRTLDRELTRRDQSIQHLQDYLADMQETNRMHVERMQQMNVEFNFQRMQMRQDFETEKGLLITKIKSDAVAVAQAQVQCMQGNHNHWQIEPYVPNGDLLHANGVHPVPMSMVVNPHPVPYHMHQELGAQQSQSPSLQHMPSPNGDGVLSDLRDRYEDIKGKENSDWMLTMMRKIVRYYEGQGMRVCEESLTNKCVSTLIWCPDGALYPDKFEAAFAMGHGNTGEEATENAVQQAYFMIQSLEAEEEESLSHENDLGDGDKPSRNLNEHSHNGTAQKVKVKYMPCRSSKSHPFIKPRTVSSSSSGCGISIRTRTSSMQSTTSTAEMQTSDEEKCKIHNEIHTIQKHASAQTDATDSDTEENPFWDQQAGVKIDIPEQIVE